MAPLAPCDPDPSACSFPCIRFRQAIPARLDTTPPITKRSGIRAHAEMHTTGARTSKVQAEEADVSKDGDHEGGHEIEGKPIEENVADILMGETRS